MKNIIYFIVLAILIFACIKQENSIVPKEVEKNPLTQTGTSLSDSTKSSTTTNGLSTIIGCTNDSVYKDTVVHLHLPTKEKLVGRWVETKSSYNSGSTDTIEFTNDSRFYIYRTKALGDETGNYNNYFKESIYKVSAKDTIVIVLNKINYYSKLPVTRKLYYNGEILYGYEIDALMTHDIRFYEFKKQ